MSILDDYLDGTTAALLRAHFGGSRLCVPAACCGDAWERLAEAIGEDHASRVVRWFAGETISIGHTADEQPADIIRKLRADGVPVKKLAQLVFPVRYSERQIYRILKGASDGCKVE